MESPSWLQVEAARIAELASPPFSDRCREPMDGSSAYTHEQPDLSFESASSADKSMTTTTRAFKTEHLSVNRPTALADRQPTARVVSLPEATPRFRMKKILEKKSARVVSMPITTLRNADASSNSFDGSGDIFVSEDEELSRVRVRSQATDVPHTPSAPSSPDSVVIIANNSNQLSNDFLRQRTSDESPPDSDDEEWISWAKSPPRPIPALHGPLSLPYARCPSGAEGTIIEEPESLPRVIWGLDSDETTGLRPAPKSSTVQTSSQKSSAPTTTDFTRPLPQTKRDPKSTKVVNTRPGGNITATPAPRQSQVSQPASTASQRNAPDHQPSQPPEFILKHSEPIDLGRLMASAIDNTHPGYYASQSTGWQSPFYNVMPTPELVHDLSPDLQTVLFAQERLKQHGISPSTTSGSLSTSSSAASLLDALKSSRSPIVIEELASQCSSQSPAFGTSGLDMAQKYRQQQFQHSLLPTPPNSTSPVWSSSFSPYHGGLLSPEFLATAGLSQFKPDLLSQSVPPHLEGSQQTFRRPLGNTRLAPAANINLIVPQQLPPRLAAEYTRRRVVPDALQTLVPPQASYDVNRSPIVPKVPPNTPHGAITSSNDFRRLDGAAAPFSHDLSANGLPQHMRSIPLSRLAQRRLSTVLEEDYASSTPPAQSRTSGGGSTDATGLHLFLSPSGRANVSAASLSLLGDTFGTRYDMDDMGVPGEKTRTVTPSAKLPGVPGQAPGPVAHTEAPLVKEPSRRQGTNNISSDGRKRGENGRGRGQKRGGRGRRGRGAERVDGGIVVKS
ncbi:hypothetical protein L226DRAFT_613655 [Lentinus tigrinus ALCF2SS1-7]|uniref:uncharacterized protein n=1 Tax=Lentinus tigrinus ALCF2SS1-7 TaxID=1328758 RepID=UPI0011662E1B|nr:hypothetical protein L226DRAFT_613655 [Lentinus tigrinus ALCF2SS1-7]